MKERFLNLAASCALATMTFVTPAALAADDCCYQPDNCYAGCNYCDEQCISVFADYLYWNVCPSSFGYTTEATSLRLRTSSTDSSIASFDLVDPINNLGGSKDHHLNPKYKSGFRVGFAYHMPDQWDLEVAYTYFHPNYKSHHRSCGDTHFVPCGVPNYAITIPVESALQVPVQPFSLAFGTTTTPAGGATLTAVDFVTDVTGGETATSSAAVTGYLTGSGVVNTPALDPATFPFAPADLVDGQLKPLLVTATGPLSNGYILSLPNIAFDFARVKATLKYDLVDILFARRYDCGGCFDYVPYVGARILNIEENIHAHYGVSNSSTSSTSSFDNCFCPSETSLLSTRHKLKLPAAGLTFGSRMNYAVCDCFNLFGHVGASILGGNAKRSFNWDHFLLNTALSQVALPSNVSFTSPFSDCDRPHNHRNHCQVIFGLDAALGLGYEWCLCNVPVLIGAGYEIQSWWNMPQHLDGTNCGGSGSSSFTVHGLFVRLGFGF